MVQSNQDTQRQPAREPVRGFYHLASAWYAAANLKDRTDGLVDEITIGLYYNDGNGGTAGEFAIVWTYLGDELVPHLRVYSDGWGTLVHYFHEFLVRLAEFDRTNPTPAAIAALLVGLGIQDLTPRTDPHAVKAGVQA